MNRAAFLLLGLALACGTGNREGLQRRPLSIASSSGWARLPLDAESQRNVSGAWIGDAAGRSVPYLEARDGLWAPRSLEVTDVVAGRDAQDRPTVAFSLKLPEGWQVRERETLRVDLELDGTAPWVAAVRAERQRAGEGFVAYDPPTPWHLFDLGASGQRRSLDLPWDGQRYRLTLAATQGTPPRITGVQVRAETGPEALETELALEGALQPEPHRPDTWRLTLPEVQRIVGLDLLLAPPVAPVRVEVRVGEGDADRTWPTTEVLWNLPALDTKATRVALPPTLATSLTFTLPEGASPAAARALVRRQILLFPAEAGQPYWLHLGGAPRPAPGNLAALPPYRALVVAAPLALGPGEPDPEGLPRVARADQHLRPWMPWIAAVAVVILGAVALRLVRGQAPSSS